MTLSHLHDLYRHQEWADARIWTAVHSSDRAVSDDDVLNLLMHIHETQHSFLNVWCDRSFERWTREKIGSGIDLCAWGKGFHTGWIDYANTIKESDLQKNCVVPWAKYFARSLGHEPAATTLGETFHQLISHSMHHRGQVARRLRELDEAPPYTDYIIWLWSDRPRPEWPL